MVWAVLRKLLAGVVLLSLIFILVACTQQIPVTVPGLSPVSGPASIAIQDQALAELKISELSINPTTVNPGDTVAVIASITNVGRIDDNYIARLGINDVTEVIKTVTVPAGKTRELTFFVSRDDIGTYTVSLGEITRQFEVINTITKTQPLSTIPVSGCCQIYGSDASLPNCCQTPSSDNVPKQAGKGCCGG